MARVREEATEKARRKGKNAKRKAEEPPESEDAKEKKAKAATQLFTPSEQTTIKQLVALFGGAGLWRLSPNSFNLVIYRDEFDKFIKRVFDGRKIHTRIDKEDEDDTRIQYFSQGELTVIKKFVALLVKEHNFVTILDKTSFDKFTRESVGENSYMDTETEFKRKSDENVPMTVKETWEYLKDFAGPGPNGNWIIFTDEVDEFLGVENEG